MHQERQQPYSAAIARWERAQRNAHLTRVQQQGAGFQNRCRLARLNGAGSRADDYLPKPL